MKQTLQNLLAEGKIKQVIAELRQLTTDDTDIKAEIVQLSARYAEYERKKRMDVEDPSVLGIELNKINSALLSVIGQLKEENTPNAKVVVNHPDTHAHNQGFSWTKWTVLNDVKSWIAVFAGLAGILTFYFKFCEQGTESVQFKGVSVTVEDKEKNLIPALLKAANVFMEVEGGEIKHQLIDEQGKAAFQNVKVGDKVKLRVAFSEPYRPLNPDSLYTIPSDGRITLTVGLQNLGRIFGTVKYGDKFMEGVLVDIEGLRDTTDLAGSFEIIIPENKQRKDPKVKFLKKDFKDMTKPAFPQNNEPMEVVLEK